MATNTLTCPQCGRKYAPPEDRCRVDGSPLFGPEVMARVGKTLNNYQVHEIIGEGGMGVVYRGEHVMLGKPVAIKILHERFAKRQGAATQFLREARAASRIRHPNIVDVTDFGTAADGSVFFVMEYLEGESLEDVLARDVRIDHFTAVTVVNQIARALAAAHEHGIVHQDLKPDNVYLINREGRRRVVRRVQEEGDKRFVVEHEGNFEFVKLLDFGVAKFNEDNLGPGLTPKTGMVFGTPHYMSPEQAQGLPVDHRSDIYSLGILFYEMLLGVVPFESDSALEILNGHVSGRVVPPSEQNPAILIDEATDRTILRCLEKEPSQRFQSMDELATALRQCFTDRVYLRDADRLPGAVEAGIVPPAPPEEPKSAQLPPSTSERKRPRTEEQRAAAELRAKKRQRLSEELAEFFASGTARIEEPPRLLAQKSAVSSSAKPQAPSAAIPSAKPQAPSAAIPSAKSRDQSAASPLAKPRVASARSASERRRPTTAKWRATDAGTSQAGTAPNDSERNHTQRGLSAVQLAPQIAEQNAEPAQDDASQEQDDGPASAAAARRPATAPLAIGSKAGR